MSLNKNCSLGGCAPTCPNRARCALVRAESKQKALAELRRKGREILATIAERHKRRDALINDILAARGGKLSEAAAQAIARRKSPDLFK